MKSCIAYNMSLRLSDTTHSHKGIHVLASCLLVVSIFRHNALNIVQ